MESNNIISLVLPTRQRPDKLERMWQSACETAKEPSNIELCLYIDNDDPISKIKIEELQIYPNGHNIHYVVGPRASQSFMTNQAYRISHGDYLHFAGDDVIWRTNNWDVTLKEIFAEQNDKILFVYPADGFQPTTFGTHGCIHRIWTEIVGYMAPPNLNYTDFIDTWWNEVADILGRKRIAPYLLEHMHPSAGKADMDMVYQEHLRHDKQIASMNEFYSLQERRLQDVEKLQNFIISHKSMDKII